MKIYLINPPAGKGIAMVREGRCMQRKGAWTTLWPPITLTTMAAMLLREGFDVKVDDCIAEDISFDRMKKAIAEWLPDLVVINTATASIYSDLTCADIARSVQPLVKSVAFGLHVTTLPEEAFGLSPALDFVIRGEPEFCLVELAQKLRDNETDFSQVRGLSYRGNNGLIQQAPNRGFDEDINKLPFPAWELIDYKKYLVPLSGDPFLLVTTSKGCPHECSFCPAKPFYGGKLRLRDYKRVVDEMEYIGKRFGVTQFLIWSESFTEERDYVVQFCNEILARKLVLRWVCNSRVDKVDLALLQLLKRAGCWMIGYGVESIDQRVLDENKKHVTVTQIEAAIDAAKQAGLEVTAHIIFGLPGETLETGKRTVAWLRKTKIDFAQIYCAVPWPSTPLYHVAKTNGWLMTDNWEMYEQNFCVLHTPDIKPKQVEYLRSAAMRAFYFSPKRILAMVERINSPRKLWLFIRALKEFLSWV